MMTGNTLQEDFTEIIFNGELQHTEVTQLTDSEIVALFLERNESAISAASEQYGRYCTKIARNILHNEQDAEECVNDTLMRAWEKIPPEKPRILSAFLAKLTRNIAIDKYRYERAERRGGGETALVFEELSECVSGGGSVEAAAERHELLAEINKFLGRQSRKNRIMFVARYCCCESIHSIASRLGLTENNVSVSLSRTRASLREYLKKRGYEL